MSAKEPALDWPAAVIPFISRSIPRCADGWDHMYATAYQIGCEALSALGQAVEAPRGATPRAKPQIPESLPRWDDICITVIRLAAQQTGLTYLPQDRPEATDRAGGATLHPSDGRAAPPPVSISPGRGTGPARAGPEVLEVLTALDLIDNGHWTDGAELVLWRDQPWEWDLDFVSDARFADAVCVAVQCIPRDVRAEIARLVIITDEDVDAAMARHEPAANGAGFGISPLLGGPRSPLTVRRGLHFLRRNELDWLFFRRWRLNDGWLADDELDRALEIFHDPVAIQMRRAVLAALHPELPAFSE